MYTEPGSSLLCSIYIYNIKKRPLDERPFSFIISEGLSSEWEILTWIDGL